MGVIVITGGSRGMGASSAEHAARRGRVITMLLSQEGAWINPQSIEVAGGYII